MEAKMVPRAAQTSAVPRPRKYLVRWTVVLGREELERMAGRPGALQKVLDHVNRAIKGSKIEIYRIVQIDEVTKSVRPEHEAHLKSARPTGIAIAEAGSVEEVRRKLEHLVEGVSFGGLPVPVENYLEFEINPLVEIGYGDKE